MAGNRKSADRGARGARGPIDTEEKARQESEIEEGQARRFWETDDEHQARIAGKPVPDDEDSPRVPMTDVAGLEKPQDVREGSSNATDHVEESERHGDPDERETPAQQ